MKNVSKDQIAVAQDVSVYDFAVAELPDAFVREGRGLRLKADHKVFVSGGRNKKYYDNGIGKSGNCIDLLVTHFGYSFVDAVEKICKYAGAAPVKSPNTLNPGSRDDDWVPSELPAPCQGKFSRVYAYLMRRGIPVSLINELVHARLLFQDERGNAVFANAAADYAEARGTNTSIPYHQSFGRKSGNYWCFPAIETADTVYVCEGAIDAISLYVLARAQTREKAVYAAIGGVGNVQAIDTLKSAGKRLIVAVDNDDAGAEFRARFPELETIIPEHKDWNEDLLEGVRHDGSRKDKTVAER